ncbi:hypothetical protein ACH4U7_49105 [Streptomyces sp. NPDC020845]|uniref:hypothetical protein n=1 Tax=Streptomyces sp. NPDC020845 TaxID=3365096 RepID=UPI0037A84DDB
MSKQTTFRGWCSRAELSAAGIDARTARGLLLSSPVADVVAPLTPEDLDKAVEISGRTLTAAGLLAGDRVVAALNSDGELTSSLYAQAAAKTAEAVVSTGPRGRMRLLKVIEGLRANVLVTTPSGAMDFLARLHMEFLADPLDLELRLIVLVGEIADDRTHKHLAREFGAEVVELFADPLLGIPLAHRRPRGSESSWQDADGSLLLARLDADTELEPPYADGLAEFVVTHPWHSTLAGLALRTGYVARLDGQAKLLPAAAHTVGDHVLVRGRWLSVPHLVRALRAIDGITRLRLEINRKGTLDTAALHVTFGRATLTGNPMWKARIEQVLTAVTPVHIDVVVAEQVEETHLPIEVVDQRGQHLGQDRASIA